MNLWADDKPGQGHYLLDLSYWKGSFLHTSVTSAPTLISLCYITSSNLHIDCICEFNLEPLSYFLLNVILLMWSWFRPIMQRLGFLQACKSMGSGPYFTKNIIGQMDCNIYLRWILNILKSYMSKITLLVRAYLKKTIQRLYFHSCLGQTLCDTAPLRHPSSFIIKRHHLASRSHGSLAWWH